MSWKFAKIAGFVAVILGSTTEASVYKLGITSGLMQQPTSNYFHHVYGGYFEVGPDKEWLLLRLGYIERPVFESQGFVDQETFSYLAVGHAFPFTGPFSFVCHIGGAQVRGFVGENLQIPNV